MAELTMRTGEKIRVIIHNSNGNSQELDSVEQLYCHVRSLRHGLNFALKDIVSKADLPRLMALFSAVAKAKLGSDNRAEKDVVFAPISPPVGDTCEVVYMGRSLFFKSDLSAVYSIFLMNEYSLSKDIVSGHIVVDAGANVGIFSLMCAVLGAKKVFAFEPVLGTFKILEDHVKLNGFEGVIIPVRKAVGNSNSKSTISFSKPGDVGASISINRGAPNSEEIDVVRLDDFLSDQDVGIIKMDVEGYEEQAILGARTIIAKFKPIMLFSAYHKPNDKQRLPEVLLGIRGDYSVKLNQYSDENFYCD